MCLSTCYFPALKNESDIFTINCTLVDYCYNDVGTSLLQMHE